VVCTTKIVWSRIFVLALIMRETGREPAPWTTRRLDFRDPWMGLFVEDVIIARSGTVPIFLSVRALGIWQAREAKVITTSSSAVGRWGKNSDRRSNASPTVLSGRPRPSCHLSLANIRRMIDQYPREPKVRPWFCCARRSSDGRITHAGTWLIRDDGGYSESTRCGLDDRLGAEQALSNYVARE
jgi:hypothetical protein